MSRASPCFCSLCCLCRWHVRPWSSHHHQWHCSARQWKMVVPLFVDLWLHQVSHDHRHPPTSVSTTCTWKITHSTIAASFGMTRVSVVFTTHTSDSQFPFACHGFAQMVPVGQSQEPKWNFPCLCCSMHLWRMKCKSACMFWQSAIAPTGEKPALLIGLSVGGNVRRFNSSRSIDPKVFKNVSFNLRQVCAFWSINMELTRNIGWNQHTQCAQRA